MADSTLSRRSISGWRWKVALLVALCLQGCGKPAPHIEKSEPIPSSSPKEDSTPPAPPASDVSTTSEPSHPAPRAPASIDDAAPPAPADEPGPRTDYRPRSLPHAEPPSEPLPTFVVVPVFVATNRALSTAPTFGRGMAKFFTEWFGLTLAVVGLVVVMAAAFLGSSETKWKVFGVTLSLLAVLAAGQSVADMLRHDPAKAGMFSADVGDTTYLECKVTVPTTGRERGEMNRPFELWVVKMKEDPTRHIVLDSRKTVDSDTFFSDVRTKVEGSVSKEALVFIHGYNVTFDEAVRRAGQLAYDIRFDGAPLCFAWPSQGTELGYPWDYNAANQSVPQLQAFLKDVGEKSGADRIYVIAHSMGNQILSQAVESDASCFTDEGSPFRHIVMAAPDVDQLVFLKRFAPRFVKCKQKVTLYGSSNDKALAASKRFNNDPRAGDTMPVITCFEGITSVDCSAVSADGFGHGYICEVPAVLDDLHALLHDLSTPGRRAAIRDGKEFWEIVHAP